MSEPSANTASTKQEDLKVLFKDYLAPLLLKAAFLSVLVVLPFLVLIRGAVFFHSQYHFSAGSALFAGIFTSAAVVYGYISVVYFKWLKQKKNQAALIKSYGIALIIVMGYCLPSLSSLSNDNLKEQGLQKEFRELHPILRLSLSTIILLDKSLILTDAERKPEDYKAMGLTSKKYSLHYRQSDGYAHAIDIRVNDRSSIRNYLIQVYFNCMGFRTLRHYGTADHLHVSLLSHDRPNAL